MEKDMDWLASLGSLISFLTTGAVVAACYLVLVAFVAGVAIFGDERGRRAKEVLALLVRVKLPPGG